MAYCKLIRKIQVTSSLKKTTDYAENEKKTINYEYGNELIFDDLESDALQYHKPQLITAINCESDSVYEVMREQLKVNPRNRPLVNICYTTQQSFKPGETTPRIAHEIGVKLAEKLWGDNFIVEITTHVDRAHLHNHFVICAVGLDGKRFNNDHQKTYDMRMESDKLCKEYGLSIITPDPNKPNYHHYAEYKAAKESGNLNTHRGQLKHDIDEVIECSITLQEFFYNMKKLGYTITSRGKYYTVYADNFQRPIRLSAKLGKGYSIEDIIQRIQEGTNRSKPLFQPYRRIRTIRCKSNHLPVKSFPSAIRGFIALYYRYCYMLGVFPKRDPDRPTRWIPPKLREDINKLQMVSDELNILVPNRITNSEELKAYKSTLEKKESVLISKRDDLRKAQKRRNITPQEVASIKYQITELTKTIKSIRYKMRLCDDIAANSSRRSEKLAEEFEHEIHSARETERTRNQTMKKERL